MRFEINNNFNSNSKGAKDMDNDKYLNLADGNWVKVKDEIHHKYWVNNKNFIQAEVLQDEFDLYVIGDISKNGDLEIIGFGDAIYKNVISNDIYKISMIYMKNNI